MIAAAETAQDLAFCLGCERRFPAHQLSAIEFYCLTCLADVAEQNARSRRDLSRRVLRAELRRLPGVTAGDMDRIIETAELAWS